MKLVRVIPLVACIAASGSEAEGDVYRCSGAEGVRYADRPCGANAVRLLPQAGPPTLVAYDAGAAPSMAYRQEPGDEAIGMEMREVLARYGRPWETRVQWHSRQLSETWTWNAQGRQFTLLFRDGRVVPR